MIARVDKVHIDLIRNLEAKASPKNLQQYNSDHSPSNAWLIIRLILTQVA
jgi:hypothetical protein